MYVQKLRGLIKFQASRGPEVNEVNVRNLLALNAYHESFPSKVKAGKLRRTARCQEVA